MLRKIWRRLTDAVSLAAIDLAGGPLMLLIGIALGAYLQAGLLDDTVLVRLEKQKDVLGRPLCAAASLDGYGRYLGAWPQGPDGACHMATFIRYRTLSFLKGALDAPGLAERSP